MGVIVRRYIDILTIIINFPYSTCISSFFGSSIPTSLFIFKMFFRSLTLKSKPFLKRGKKNNVTKVHQGCKNYMSVRYRHMSSTLLNYFN